MTSDLEDKDGLTPEDLDEIQLLSIGLSEEECLLYFGFESKDDLKDDDKKKFIRAFNRGRLRGKRMA